MDLNYTKDKGYEFVLHIWKAMEDLQEKYPHLELGWYGFIFMVVYR